MRLQQCADLHQSIYSYDPQNEENGGILNIIKLYYHWSSRYGRDVGIP